MERREDNPVKKLRVVLSLPRCGTHFMWSRYIASGYYQIVFDADIVPALTILADVCEERMEILNPPPVNLVYNFAYHSLEKSSRSLTAREHLNRLSEKYGMQTGFELFRKIMSLQDDGGRCLLSVSRFVYTNSYRFPFKEFEWTIGHAAESFRLLHEWLALAGYEATYVMVIRKIPEWIKSQLLLQGAKWKKEIANRIWETPVILETCQDLNVPIFWMKDVIEEMNRGRLDFENYLEPLSTHEVQNLWGNPAQYTRYVNKYAKGFKPRKFRMGRFIQYIAEKDPIKRISLVRSIGWAPIATAKYLPFLGRRIQEDFDGLALCNAKLKQG